jgi:glycosyltransferase involved in cell wall biosynthesis
VRLNRYPKVSVIVCSYNGAKTLGECLRALDRIEYPDFEVVLVDDGSHDETQEVVAAWLAERADPVASGMAHGQRAETERQRQVLPPFVSIVQENMGLSYARNSGAQAARGEIFAYTDSDCMPELDWLYYLVGTLLSGDYAGVGGPNIPPPAFNGIQAAVAAAPGGRCMCWCGRGRERVPGYSGISSWAFECRRLRCESGRPSDDVDFCGSKPGRRGGVQSGAIVRHYRRYVVRLLVAAGRTARPRRCCVSNT